MQARSNEPSRIAPQRRFIVLLIALLLVLVITPVWRLLAPASTPGAARVVVAIVFMIMLVAAGYAVGRSVRMLIVASTLAALVGVLQILVLLIDGPGVRAANQLATILFVGYLITQGLRYLFTVHTVTMDTIAASLCIYILLGLLWSSVFTLTEILVPGSFAFAYAEEVQPGRFGDPGSGAALYYSLVTLSTLGYGDVVPTSPSARLFAAIEAIIGQAYLAVIVARLVGLQIAGRVANQGR
ncbi:MAG: two pore domain potassium channel family protein [Phycisphaerales bacterium]|nr:MAG: two pore domain potassium channel family protein [Phycisphaerales bacterium]